MLKTNLVIKDIRELKSGAFRLGVITPLLNDKEKVVMRGAKGWQFESVLKPISDQNDIDLNLSGTVETRSPSQILRYEIYGLWVKRGEEGDAEDFYRRVMASLTSLIKDK